KFTESSYNVTVREDVPVGFVLVIVQAVDRDSGHHGEVRYALSNRTGASYPDMFSIDTNSGAVTLLRPLDHEKQSVCILVVMATDCGINPLSSAASVTINVLDVNDNAPLITVDAV